MYKIKQIPEDFGVKEVSELDIDKIGKYSYFILEKKNYTTLDAIRKISYNIRVAEKNIGFAGNKDKHAVTKQFISIKYANLNLINKMELKDISLKHMGNGKIPISLGDLKGNSFEITVRNLIDEDIDDIEKKMKKIGDIPNYYDEQRFSKVNVKVGKLLLQRKFKEACKVIGDSSIDEYLNDNKNNFVGALKLLPKRRLIIYVHSVQSYIFNETVRGLVGSGKKIKYSMGYFVFPSGKLKNVKIPLVGFGTEFENKKIKKMVEKIMKKEKIRNRDFIFKELPISSEGGVRDLLIGIEDLSIVKIGKDALHKRKHFVKVKFFLQKGSYATIVLRKLFS